MKRYLIASVVAALLLSVGVAPTVSAAPRVFVAQLEPDLTCPDTTAQGTAIVRLNDDGTLTYRLVVANIDHLMFVGGTPAHIHEDPTGGILQGLTPVLITKNSVVAAGTVEATPALVEELNAGEAYVNVHTTDCFVELTGPLQEVSAGAAPVQ